MEQFEQRVWVSWSISKSPYLYT